MLYTMAEHDTGPIAVRYPRGSGVGVPLDTRLRRIPIGEAEPLREGRDVTILAIGAMVYPSLAAAETLAEGGISCGVVNARFVKPLDDELILELATRHGVLVTAEEAQRAGGFGSAVAELLHDRGVSCRVVSIAIPDRFVEHATPAEQRRSVGLTAEEIAARVREAVTAPLPGRAPVARSA
jgi:1-deoxy-D-xylulose-5-phosphate synthase